MNGDTATFRPSSQAPRIWDALHACAFIRYLEHIRPILEFDYYRRGARPAKEGALEWWPHDRLIAEAAPL